MPVATRAARARDRGVERRFGVVEHLVPREPARGRVGAGAHALAQARVRGERLRVLDERSACASGPSTIAPIVRATPFTSGG